MGEREMEGDCLMVSIDRRKTVLTDGSELSKEILWGGENLKRAMDGDGDFIMSLVKEMKVLADEIDRFLEASPNISMIRLLAGDEYLHCFDLILRQYYKNYRFAKLKWV